MRYEIRSQDDERSVTIEAVDWMMAMSQAIERWSIQVSGWSCSTRANGDVHVMDPTSGLRWVVSPLRTETARRPLRRAHSPTVPPPPPAVGRSLGAPPPPAVRSVLPKTVPPVEALDAPDSPVAARPIDVPRAAPSVPRATPPAPPKAPLPVAKLPAVATPPPTLIRKTSEGVPSGTESVPQSAPTPKVAMPTDGPFVPDYGKDADRLDEVPEVYTGRPYPLEAASPSIAKATPPSAGPVTLRPENLAERLFELAEDVSEASTAYEACELTLEHCMASIRCEAGSVLRGSINDQALTFVACAGPAGDALVGRKLRFGRGIVGRSFDLGFTIVVNDVEQDENHLRKVDDETGFRTRNVLCTPVRTEEEHFGVLQLLNTTGGFQGWHVQVAESLALSLAAALAAGLH